MGKKRKNTAKTGDKAMYKNRPGGEEDRKSRDDGDPIYNKVDAFHNEREEEYMGLDTNKGDSDDDDALVSREQHVMDLGVGGDSDESSASDEEESSDDDQHMQANPQEEQEQDDVSSSDDDDDEEEEEMDPQEMDPRNWGKKKSAYYHGDTADLEIGQEEDDAFVEEEAAREVQTSRFQDMADDDFAISSGDEEPDEKETTGDDLLQERLTTTRDTTKLSLQEKRKLLKKQHPELLPVVSYFADVVQELNDTTRVATQALTEHKNAAESVGASLQGQQYLLTKSMMQHSVALNTALYLLLKSSGDNDDDEDHSTLHNNNIDAHPVMAQLKRCNSTMQKFDEHVHKKAKGDLKDQVSNLVKAAALLQESGEGLEEEDDEEEESSSASQDEEMEVSDDDQEPTQVPPTAAAKKQDNAVARERVLEDARFGLRQNEIGQPPRKKTGRTRQASSSTGDFGDLDGTEAKSFASTINAIEQRSRTESRKRSAAPLAEQLDDHVEDHEVTQGVKMMEEEMDKLDGGGVEENLGKGDPGLKDPDADTELADGLDFYNAVAKKSKAKKAFKKSLYEVAPKFPGNDSEVHGERAISRTIMKNRGLVAHKSKLNRNPRVKKREQYRKALIRRKGAVREVRTEEGHKYGGEETGIKTKLSRSRKLKS